MTPVMTSAIGGQPGTLMTGLSRITSCTGVALRRVGLGGLHAAPRRAAAPGTTAMASAAISLQLVDEWPAADDAVVAVLASGGLPSTQSMYLPA